MNELPIALWQHRVTGSPIEQLARLQRQVMEARKKGVRLFCTQELFLTPYFCSDQNAASFDWAEEIPGSLTDRLCSLCAASEMVLVASLFERQAEGLYFNTTVVIDADGTFLGKYRKAHIPQDPGFEEKFYFTPGDSGYPVWETSVGPIGVLICWDQWFPEAARLLALRGAELIIYPTAIGYLPDEKSSLGASQRQAWQTVMQGHAVANGVHIAAINRVGREGEIEFWGGSFLASPYGEITAQASDQDEQLLLVEMDHALAKDFRRTWPFFRDRRIETYEGINQRWLP